MIPNLVGGWTNPSDKYWSNWSISPERGENKKHVKPPPRNGLPPMYDIPDVDTHVIGYREQPHTFAAAFSCYVHVQSICERFQLPSITTNIAGRKHIKHDLEVGKTIMFLRNKALDVHFQPTIMIVSWWETSGRTPAIIWLSWNQEEFLGFIIFERQTSCKKTYRVYEKNMTVSVHLRNLQQLSFIDRYANMCIYDVSYVYYKCIYIHVYL